MKKQGSRVLWAGMMTLLTWAVVSVVAESKVAPEAATKETPVKARPLVVVYGAHNSAPYTLRRRGRLEGGIIRDIWMELARDLDCRVKFQRLPRGRYAKELMAGNAHVIPVMNPAWLDDSARFGWSDPIFPEKDVIVVSTNRPLEIKRIEDLDGKRLGATLGYHYTPELEARFASRTLRREDVQRMEQNFAKLERGRIDCFIDSDIMIAWYLKKNQKQEAFQIAEWVESRHQIQMAISPKSPVTPEQINAALKKMEEQGRIKAILARYR